MAHFRILQEAVEGQQGDWHLCFQYGIYEYDPDKPREREIGYRFIWRRPNGQLQGARGQARLEPELITVLLGKAAAGGWYPIPPHKKAQNVRMGDRVWSVSVQPPIVVRSVGEGDHIPQPPQGGIHFTSAGDHYFLPMGYPELPSAIDFMLASQEQVEGWLVRAQHRTAV